ncbi:ribonuclease Z [Clostridium intestinale]|uniref:Ribonuclease Z n=1 Tax=Clostridium intestinale URNW TaxID=1294142 RepID=U2Q6W6_9CLOT|nr:ribonuclease Z [Clostridium intestinale]ERK31904.1 ribonuclease Z [Clostridium intestinale URNW]
MIDVVLLGCGGGMPMPNRNLSSILLNYRGRKILVDCGEGTQVSMRMVGWGFKTIDIICITHIHGDHIVGLPGLLATIGNSGRTEPLAIIGPEGIENTVNSLRVICPYLPYDIKIIENPHDSIELDNFINISTLNLDHSAPCLGYSFYIKRAPKFNVEKALENNVPKNLWNVLQKGNEIEFKGRKYYPSMVLGEDREGIKLSIITDTRPIEEIIDFVRDSYLFICEGTYGDDNDIEKAIRNKHMTFREAANLAKNAEIGELLLTHFSPAMEEPSRYLDNAKEVFNNIIIGEDRLTKTLSFKNS